MIHLVSFLSEISHLYVDIEDDFNALSSGFFSSGNSSIRLQHLFEKLFAAIEFEETHLDSSEEERKEWKEWFDCSSATYLYCQLRHLSMQHLQARAVRHQ